MTRKRATQLQLRRNDLECFDRLPAQLRCLLNDADFKFSAAALYRMWHDYGMTCDQIIKHLEREQAEARR